MAASLAYLLLVAASWSKTYTPVGPPEVRVDAAVGGIAVTAWERPDIAVQITTAGWKIGESEVRVQDSLAGNLLDLRVTIPKDQAGFTRRTVHIQIQLPRQTACALKTGGGAISITGVQGAISAETPAGNIDATDLDGKLTAKCGQGRIRASGRFDALTLETSFGAIDADSGAGSRMFGPWRLSTGSGNVTLRLPAGFQAGLEAEASLGKVTVGVPVTYSGTHRLLNGGGETLRIRAESGDIRVVQHVSKE